MTRILICRPGAEPEERQVRSLVETFHAVCGSDSYLESVFLKRPGVVVWCDDSFLLKSLPPNRLVPVARAEYVIGGAFLLSRVDAEGATRSLADEDIEWVREHCPRRDEEN